MASYLLFRNITVNSLWFKLMEDIKLYKYFVSQLNSIGKVKRAWFTTFNLDISFFEKYILSALVGIDFKDLKTPYDYEALNSYLANENEELSDDKIEVKVFYDYRTLVASGKSKQTSVQLHSIDVKQFSRFDNNLKYSNGVFHPKVILLENSKGEYWLMVSSANLTFGGWSKNRECFFFEKIESTKVARDIGAFFLGIGSTVKGFEANDLIDKFINRRVGTKESNWYFFSSFDSNSFLDQLNYSNEPSPLKVWSPYFADDLDELIKETEEYFDSIEIIPAKNENQKIRVTEEIYNKCISNKNILFKQDKLPQSLQETFVHAKVWLTPTSLAIGSWNMTRSGMNISKKANNNIEAGIIYNLTPKEYKELLANHTSQSIKSLGHYKEDELKQEKEGIVDDFNLMLDLVADWDTLIIELSYPKYSKLDDEITKSQFVKLPGIGKIKFSQLENGISFREFKKSILNDRLFEVEDKNGKTAFRGYLREKGLASRPVNSFDNIDDYLKGWVSERPEDKEELHRLAYPIDEECGDELSEQTKTILLSNSQNAWFTSFHAFECIVNRINQVNEYKYKADRVNELKRIGRILPGSLSELKEHLEILLELYNQKNGNFKKSATYLWFVIEKANHVFKFYNKIIEIKEEQIKSIQNINFDDLIKETDSSKINNEQLLQWKALITKTLKIES